jgi:hypothetical protein
MTHAQRLAELTYLQSIMGPPPADYYTALRDDFEGLHPLVTLHGAESAGFSTKLNST